MGKNSPAYQAQYRAENPEYVEAQRERAKARSAAARRLKEAYPKQYATFLKEELLKLKLNPEGS